MFVIAAGLNRESFGAMFVTGAGLSSERVSVE